MFIRYFACLKCYLLYLTISLTRYYPRKRRCGGRAKCVVSLQYPFLSIHIQSTLYPPHGRLRTYCWLMHLTDHILQRCGDYLNEVAHGFNWAHYHVESDSRSPGGMHKANITSYVWWDVGRSAAFQLSSQVRVAFIPSSMWLV